MLPEIEKMLALIKSYGRDKGMDFMEFVDICIYPAIIEEWISSGMGSTSIKKAVDERFSAYNKQRKYLSSLA